MNRLCLLSCSALVACVALVGTSASAQDAREFDIPPGALGDALQQFATQSDQQIFFSGDVVDGLRTEGVRGLHAPAAALNILLRGSGLSWSETRPGVILVRRAAASVQVEAPATTIDDVVVTGSLLKKSGELASPVVTLDRDALDRRGFGTVADTLADLPQNYAGSGTPAASLAIADAAGSNSAAATGVNLRGLGPSATLVLVNGRRVAGTGFRGEFADLSALPSAAVERVDILLDGASALYGSDAVAGVVNVIMRRRFDGQETRVRASAAKGGAEDVIVSHLAGRSWATGAALLAWEYQTVNALNSGDRVFTADGDLRPFGGSDRRNVFSAPGNILAYDPGQGAYVAAYGIRPGASGSALTPADFATGEANLQSELAGVDLNPEFERHSLYGRIRQSVGNRLELSADLRFSRRAYQYANAATVSIFQVSDTNPFFVSPSGESAHLVGYSFYRDLGTSHRTGISRSLGVTAGGDYDLGRGWSLEGYLALAEERGESRTTGLVNSAFLTEALGNTPDDPATNYVAARDGYFNPFGAGAANSRVVLDFIGSGALNSLDRNRAQSVNILLQGAVFQLPGGDLEIALGAQARRETFGARQSSFTASVTPTESLTSPWSRTVTALFGEARVPIIGPDNARPGLRRLELSLAGRVEDYDDFGQTTNPKVGVIWSPAPDMVFRASWGTSFRAPSLPQMNDASEAAPTFVERADGASVLSLYRYGGNTDLQPETAETWTAGFDYAPRGGPKLSLGYFDTRFTNRIAQPVNENLSGALTDPALAPFVTLINPSGDAADLALITSYISAPSYGYGDLFPATSYGAILDARWVNASSVRVRGIDLSAAYPLVLGAHQISFEASGSYLLDYETRLTPTSVERSVLGRIGYPVRLRSRVGVFWTHESLSAGVHWRHVAAYEDAARRAIKAWDTADLQMSWAPDDGPLKGVRLVASVQNLFDRPPPFYDSPTGLGFDPGQADLFGRVLSLQLIKRW